MKYIYIISISLLLSACTYAGPYVTNISRNKNGDLVVEKCQVLHNAWLGVVSNENCINQTI